jgi:hypothetical protein
VDIAAALRRAGVAEVGSDRRLRAEYSSDASNYRVPPAAVVFPRHPDEVLATLAVPARRSRATPSGPAWCSTSPGT